MSRTKTQPRKCAACGNALSSQDQADPAIRFCSKECWQAGGAPASAPLRTIEGTLEAAGFKRNSTGGGCEAAESEVSNGLYICVTDGDAGFPDEDTENLYIGVFQVEHGDALWDRNVVLPSKPEWRWEILDQEIGDAKAKFELLTELLEARQEESYEAGFAQGIQVAREAHGCTDESCRHIERAEKRAKLEQELGVTR